MNETSFNSLAKHVENYMTEYLPVGQDDKLKLQFAGLTRTDRTQSYSATFRSEKLNEYANLTKEMYNKFLSLYEGKKNEIIIRSIITKPPNCLVNSGNSLILSK